MSQLANDRGSRSAWMLSVALVTASAGCRAPSANTRVATSSHQADGDGEKSGASFAHQVAETTISPPRPILADAGPKVPSDLTITALVGRLGSPEWISTMPNGDVLVGSRWDAGRPDAPNGGARGATRVVLLRDTDGDGRPDLRTDFAVEVGEVIAAVATKGDLFVATNKSLWRFPHFNSEHDFTDSAKLVTLPGQSRFFELALDSRTSKLYATVAANEDPACASCTPQRKDIWEVDAHTGAHRVYASSLSGPCGLAVEPATGALWTIIRDQGGVGVNHERAAYLTAVPQGGSYDWPANATTMGAQPADRARNRFSPDYTLGQYSAVSGLQSSNGNSLPPRFDHGLFVSQAEASTRDLKVSFVSFRNGIPTGRPFDVVTGHRTNDTASCRRELVLDHGGGLLVLDTLRSTIWRVTAATTQAFGR